MEDLRRPPASLLHFRLDFVQDAQSKQGWLRKPCQRMREALLCENRDCRDERCLSFSLAIGGQGVAGWELRVARRKAVVHSYAEQGTLAKPRCLPECH